MSDWECSLGPFAVLRSSRFWRSGGRSSVSAAGGPVSVEPGEDTVAHAAAVLLPRRAVLPPALPLVAGVAVDQQDAEVDQVVVGQEVAEP